MADTAQLNLVIGTKVQGYEKRELSDEWVPAQLWVITKAEGDSVYKIENANSRTIMDLTASMSVSSHDAIMLSSCPYPQATLLMELLSSVISRTGTLTSAGPSSLLATARPTCKSLFLLVRFF